MDKDTVNILIGDSISYGYGDKSNLGWFHRFKLKCLKDSVQFFFNLSIPGERSFEIAERFENEFLVRYNELDDFNLILSFGINDAKDISDGKEKIDDFQQNINSMISFAKQFSNVKIFFLGLMEIDSNIRKGIKKENIKLVNDTIKLTCDKYKINYISMDGVISTEDLIDGLHPNDNGHKKISEYLYSKIYK